MFYGRIKHLKTLQEWGFKSCSNVFVVAFVSGKVSWDKIFWHIFIKSVGFSQSFVDTGASSPWILGSGSRKGTEILLPNRAGYGDGFSTHFTCNFCLKMWKLAVKFGFPGRQGGLWCFLNSQVMEK